MTESERQALREQIEALLNEYEITPWNDRALLATGWQVPYEQKVQVLCNTAQLEDTPTLLRITQQGTVQRSLGRTHSVLLGCFDSMALAAARALVRLAEAQPSRELIAVLVVLQKQALSINAPLEFIPIRIRLARALKKINNLPIPASPPPVSDDLPIPSDQDERNAG